MGRRRGFLNMTEMAAIRKFRWSDLGVLTRLFNEITGRANSDGAYDTELMAQVLSQPTCDPEQNCYLAEWGGSPVGFALISPEPAIRRAPARWRCPGGRASAPEPCRVSVREA